MTDWVSIGRVEDIPSLGARVLRTVKGDIAVFRTAKDEIFAMWDSCPHKGGPLSQGIVHDRRVTCPLHNWVMDLSTGTAVGPDQGCTATFPVRVEDGQVMISFAKKKVLA